jgi:hypothetical protein
VPFARYGRHDSPVLRFSCQPQAPSSSVSWLLRDVSCSVRIYMCYGFGHGFGPRVWTTVSATGTGLDHDGSKTNPNSILRWSGQNLKSQKFLKFVSGICGPLQQSPMSLKKLLKAIIPMTGGDGRRRAATGGDGRRRAATGGDGRRRAATGGDGRRNESDESNE